jgi:hypothetical protein
MVFDNSAAARERWQAPGGGAAIGTLFEHGGYGLGF